MNAREIAKRSQDRALRAVELYRRGLTYEEISVLIGYEGPITPASAKHIVRKGEYLLQRRAAHQE